MLLFRLSGVFLLRYAARQFSGLLFQEPPRRTRDVMTFAPHKHPFTAEAPDQPPAISLTGVADPTDEAWANRGPVDLATADVEMLVDTGR